MQKVKKFFKNFERNLCVLLLTVILFVLTYQVIARYFLSATPSWSEELARYLFVWLIFVGASYAAQEVSHIRIETLNKVWPASWRKWVISIGNIIWLVFCITMLIVSGAYTYKIFATKQISIGVKINMGWAYLGIPLGYALMIIRIIINMFEGKIIQRSQADQLGEVDELIAETDVYIEDNNGKGSE